MGIKFPEGAAPSTPASGKAELFLDAYQGLKVIRDTGEVVSPRQPYYNYLINGSFLFGQRQAPGTLTTFSDTTGRSYGLDRWGMTNENASIQSQRIDTSGASETGLYTRHYGKFKKITNAGKIIISQVIEGAAAQALVGKTVRFSAKMRYSVAGSMTVRMAVLALGSGGTVDTMPATFASAFGGSGTDPTWGTNLTALTPVDPQNGSIVGNGVTCVLTNAWVQYSGAVTIPANAKNVVVVIFSNSQLAANDELNIGEAYLTADRAVVDFVAPLPADELVRCQRYYQKSFPIDTAPVTNLGLNGGEHRFSALRAGALINYGATISFPVIMRIAPSAITLFNPAAANAQARDVDVAADCASTNFFNPSERGFSINTTGAAGTAVGNRLAVGWTAEGEI